MLKREKTPMQSKCSFGIGRLGIFVQFAHKNNSQDFKHECKKALPFKWFLLKVSERASEWARKIAYETKLNVLEASQSWKTSIFILLVCFGSKPSTCMPCVCVCMCIGGVYAFFNINENRNSCVFPSKSKCDHFLCSLFIRSCKIECYKMVDKPTFQHVLPVCM